MKRILIVNGPNINMTGIREVGVYGSASIAQINEELKAKAQRMEIDLEIRQSNHEGDLVDWIQEAYESFDGIILNAGAYTHYSYALRDAISAVGKPCIEVHFSNIQARDGFRRESVIAPVCQGTIAGFGKTSYLLALDAMAVLV